MDGTDCRISEPAPFNTAWFSHKFKGSGLRYEIAISLDTGHILWCNGPFPCGSHPDVKIFRLGLKNILDENEVVTTDRGYSDESCLKNVEDHQDNYRLQLFRAWHETVNRMLKSFSVLFSMFRHNPRKHSPCFHAVCNIVHLKIKYDDLTPFRV